MKLDKRIFPAKRPLTCFDSEFAKQFIGKECYFASKFENFENLSNVPHATLHNVDDSSAPFQCYGDDGILCYDCFILPCEWVQEHKEPKWRPFSLTEWRHNYSIGDAIVCRLKNSDTTRVYMFCGLFSDHDDDLPGKGVINLGGELFVLQNLFDLYELHENNEWHPFGVEVKE